MIALGETCFSGHLTIVLRQTEIHDNVIIFVFIGTAHALCLGLQTFDECVSAGGSDCAPEKLWLQIPFFCGHYSECW